MPSMPMPLRVIELLALTGANILATLLRFVLLRLWVFRVRGDGLAGLPRGPSKSWRCECPGRQHARSARRDDARAGYRAAPRRWMPRHVAGLLRGPFGDPAWERPALVVLLAFTTLLYTWGLDRNGWANSYYSAAAMSGSQDWTAFLFGSSDPGNAITVDKPPLSMWVMSLSVRMFGLSPWSLLLPQSVMGVTCVYLLYRMVRKRFDAATGLLAGAFLAVTPVATVMFRYNNPDALLTLLMIGTAYCTLESLKRGQLRWLLAAGLLTGACAPHQATPGPAASAFRRAGLCPVRPDPSVQTVSASPGRLSRPRPWGRAGGGFCWSNSRTLPNGRSSGASRNNSAIELTFGYNGVDRLTGEDATRTMATGITGSARHTRCRLPAIPAATILRAERVVPPVGRGRAGHRDLVGLAPPGTPCGPGTSPALLHLVRRRRDRGRLHVRYRPPLLHPDRRTAYVRPGGSCPRVFSARTPQVPHTPFRRHHFDGEHDFCFYHRFPVDGGFSGLAPDHAPNLGCRHRRSFSPGPKSRNGADHRRDPVGPRFLAPFCGR